jgi:hypothetical protein
MGPPRPMVIIGSAAATDGFFIAFIGGSSFFAFMAFITGATFMFFDAAGIMESEVEKSVVRMLCDLWVHTKL